VISLTVSGLFEEGTGIIPISPENVLGACTERLDHRFASVNITMQQNLLNDYQVEDERFHDLVNNHRMQSWYESALETARFDHKAEMDQITSSGSDMRRGKDALELAEERIAEKEQGKVDATSRSKSEKAKSTANGHARSTRASILQH
jgi:nuclear pore complex protein Nup133